MTKNLFRSFHDGLMTLRELCELARAHATAYSWQVSSLLIPNVHEVYDNIV